MTNLFDTRAQTWDEEPRRLKLAADIFAAFERQVSLRPGMSALDYGCGTGLLTLALAARVRHVTAVDSSSGMLDALAQKVKSREIHNVGILLSDFAQGPVPAGPYDLVASAMTLHHVADIESLFQKFFALLAPGGQIALADLDTEDGSFHGHRDGIHHLGFDRQALAKLLAACGFVDIRFDPAARVTKTREYTVFLATARKP
jgi:ubiquinone/menaquinone biosynthesis C-methylase UbiE